MLKADYEKWFQQFKPYSDFSFNNLLIWLNLNDDLELSALGDTLIYRYTNPFGEKRITYTLLGRKTVQHAIEQVFTLQKQSNSEMQLSMVPEEATEYIDQAKYVITEDRDDFDYIFDSRNWYYLPSTEKHLRRRVKHVAVNYGDDLLIRELDLNIPENKALIVNGMHLWKAFYSIAGNDKLGLEGLAINNCLSVAGEVDEKCLAIYVNDILVSVLLYHLPPQTEYAIINHVKCDYKIPNIFDFTIYCAISKLYPQGIKYFNGEQDLGIEGLRKHKQLLHPVDFLKRYSVSPV